MGGSRVLSLHQATFSVVSGCWQVQGMCGALVQAVQKIGFLSFNIDTVTTTLCLEKAPASAFTHKEVGRWSALEIGMLSSCLQLSDGFENL